MDINLKCMLLKEKVLENSNPNYIVYCYSNPYVNYYFYSYEELWDYINNNDTAIGHIYALEYIGNAFERNNVIKKITNETLQFYSIISDKDYEILNIRKKSLKNIIKWEYFYGNISNYYTPFCSIEKQITQKK